MKCPTEPQPQGEATLPLGSQLEVCLRFCLGLGFKNQVPGVCVGVGVCVCVFVREREREREREGGRKVIKALEKWRTGYLKINLIRDCRSLRHVFQTPTHLPHLQGKAHSVNGANRDVSDGNKGRVSHGLRGLVIHHSLRERIRGLPCV